MNLLRSLPATVRDVAARGESKTPERIAVACEFGEEYFDGPREFGYGGYRYDGRWIPVSRDIVRHFNLKPGDRVLDVGCAKGFLVKDLLSVCPGLEAFGLDISEYAILHCEPETIGRLHLGSATHLPFPSRSFDAVISINTIHNLAADDAVLALREVERLAPGRGFVQVDAYHTQAQRDVFMQWMLTAKCHDYPAGWYRLFERAGYTGDWWWTIA